MYQKEVLEVIQYIKGNLHDSLELNKIAKHISYSPYHFSRLFKQETGLSPVYFVSSLRLQKAKELLMTTDLPVRDIGMEIGQQSLGTFTTRFSSSIGLTPAKFRHYARQRRENYLEQLSHLTTWQDEVVSPRQESTAITGHIRANEPFHGVIFIGLFQKPIPEGMPIYGTLIQGTGSFTFQGVNSGVYYLLVTALSWDSLVTDIYLPYHTLRARLKKPLIVDDSVSLKPIQLTLRGPELDDPPILISLPLLMKRFLDRATT
ncbi:helix-turn-helix domain-containing protein [Alkalihalobacillus pseudalcaliphilus]|uniref:helix-turn-helix domain-containing protein n=1 Tax=Alkalihalobacillus pseudalcaliphilus TaxID=79884 RepID=UPI00064DBCF8|nr:helix-turn-helix transcriptional regulator [Alkalihalobacillus pseudalcaliphilus]KMK77735.1 transcriptional regulator [Alkalihalobacillus pseudalcaliphilus]